MDDHTRFRLEYSRYRDLLFLIRKELEDMRALLAKEPDTQFMRRLKVRVLFACIEGFISHLKGTSQTFAIGNEGVFTVEETLFLRDQMAGKDGNPVKAKITLRENIKRSFALFAKATGTAYEIDFGSEASRGFLSGIIIRDRITHAKDAQSWQITDSDAETIEKAWNWFGDHLISVSTKAATKAQSEAS